MPQPWRASQPQGEGWAPLFLWAQSGCRRRTTKTCARWRARCPGPAWRAGRAGPLQLCDVLCRPLASSGLRNLDLVPFWGQRPRDSRERRPRVTCRQVLSKNPQPRKLRCRRHRHHRRVVIGSQEGFPEPLGGGEAQGRGEPRELRTARSRRPPRSSGPGEAADASGAAPSRQRRAPRFPPAAPPPGLAAQGGGPSVARGADLGRLAEWGPRGARSRRAGGARPSPPCHGVSRAPTSGKGLSGVAPLSSHRCGIRAPRLKVRRGRRPTFPPAAEGLGGRSPGRPPAQDARLQAMGAKGPGP